MAGTLHNALCQYKNVMPLTDSLKPFVSEYGQQDGYTLEALDGYVVNEHGLITNPGKFQNEKYWTPFFNAQCLDGFGDAVPGTESDNYVPIAAADGNVFPELAQYVGQYAIIRESSDGFVSCEIVEELPDNREITVENTELEWWAERDRLHINLSYLSGESIWDVWDEDVQALFDDGFLSDSHFVMGRLIDRKGLHREVVDYVIEHDIKPTA